MIDVYKRQFLEWFFMIGVDMLTFFLLVVRLSLIHILIYALVTGFGAFRILSGTGFTVGQLVTFLNYVNQYTKPFNDISSVLAELQSALACAERLYSVLDVYKRQVLWRLVASLTLDQYSVRRNQKLAVT